MAPEARLTETMKAVVRDDLPGLIEAARSEARDRVRAVLVDAMAEAMLQSIRDDAVSVNTDATGLWAYGVVTADAELPAELSGVTETPVEMVRNGSIAALVSSVPMADFDESPLRGHLEDVTWLERTARRHQHVLDEVGARATLVPMRMCTVYRDAESVVSMLTAEGPALTEALEHLRGKAEWGVKAFVAHAERADGDATEGASAETSGADYMRRRAAARELRLTHAQRCSELAQVIHERIAAVVSAALANPPQPAEASGRSEPMVLNGVYLVKDSELNRFLDLISELQGDYGEQGLLLEPTGPWPAYNFIPGTIGAAW